MHRMNSLGLRFIAFALVFFAALSQAETPLVQVVDRTQPSAMHGKSRFTQLAHPIQVPDIYRYIVTPVKNNPWSNAKWLAAWEQFGGVNRWKWTAGSQSGERWIVQFPNAGLTQAGLRKILEETGAFSSVEVDAIGFGHGAAATDPNDPFFARQWGLKNTGVFSFDSKTAKLGADIEAEAAWDLEQGDDSLIIAVLDCGLNVNHPDIAARVWTNADEIPGNGKDDDGNGYVDDVHGWSFSNDAGVENQAGTNDVKDDYGHGTNVAGIIGAISGNGVGVAGVIPRARIMPVKVLNKENWGYFTWWAAGLRYAVDNGAKVVNMSMGGPNGQVSVLKDAVDYAVQKGVTVVVSMGNGRTSVPEYPAAYPGVIAVGATDPQDRWVRSFFWDTTKGSNYGPHISVSAPGNYIYGLSPSNVTSYDSYWGGTSQAAPHVAGVCALLFAQDPTRTPAQIKSLIESGAEDLVGDLDLDVAGFDLYFGHGRLNARRSLEAGAVVKLWRPQTQRAQGAEGGWKRSRTLVDFRRLGHEVNLLGRTLPRSDGNAPKTSIRGFDLPK